MRNIKTYRAVLLEGLSTAKGREMSTEDFEGFRRITDAIMDKRTGPNTIKRLLQETGIDPATAYDPVYNERSLMEWCLMSHNPRSHEFMKILLDAGGDPNQECYAEKWDYGADGGRKTLISGYTLLHRALRAYDDEKVKPETIKAILDAGADPNRTDGNGIVPLFGSVRTFIDETGVNVFTGQSFKRSDKYRGNFKEKVKEMIKGGADPMLVFKDTDEFWNFFDGDLDWMPDVPLKSRLQKTHRGASLFGI